MSTSLANEIVYKTPSEYDSIMIVSDGNVLYARKGAYGGWVVSRKLEKVDLALWCPRRDVVDVNIDDLSIEVVKKFIEELKKYNIAPPSARKVTYYYKPIKATIVKATDKYTVIDFAPEATELTAEATHLYWKRHYSRRHRCYGQLCNASERERAELVAKMFGLDAYEACLGSGVFEVRIKIVTNAKDLEPFLKPKAPAEPEVQEVQEEVEEEEQKPKVQIEIKPKELEVELTPTPPTPAPALTAVKPKAELVKIYLLAMRLPSKYLLQEIEVNKTTEVRKWGKEVIEAASRLEGIRRTAYTKIERIFAHVEEYGTWIAITEEAVKEAKELSSWIREELGKEPVKKALEVKGVDVDKVYSVKAVTIYLEPEDAKELLNVATRHLSEDIEELAKKIAEAEKEQDKKALKRLNEDLAYKKALLESFRKFLSQL